MYSQVETITPEMAKEYLKHNEGNRPLKKNAIANYAHDMKTGNWQLSPQGISFYESGRIADGQNRLHAIIQAGVPVNMYVTRDVPNESTIQDRCVVRSSTDIFRMGGKTGSAYGTRGVAIANCLFDIAGVSSISIQTRSAFLDENETMVSKAVNITTQWKTSHSSLCRKASLMSACFCALYCGIPEEGLKKFFDIVNSGFSQSPKETAAIVLRNYLVQDYDGSGHGGRRAVFKVATLAIRDFANEKPRTKKYPSDAGAAFWNYTKKNLLDKYLSEYITKK